MDPREVERRFIEVVAEQLGRDVGELSCETTVEELRVDSLDVVELVMEMEDVFGVRLPDATVGAWRTLGDGVQWIIDQGEGGAGVTAKLRPRPWPPHKGRSEAE